MLPQDPDSASGPLVLISPSSVGFRLWALYLIILWVRAVLGGGLFGRPMIGSIRGALFIFVNYSINVSQ